MVDILRQEIAANASPIVIKVGTRVLTRDNGQLDEKRIGEFADQIHALRTEGREVVMVSSGAVGAGLAVLGLAERPASLAKLQAVAAVGQAKLIETYDARLQRHGYRAGQILLTASDLHHRSSYLNVRHTLLSLLELGAVPIINENDSVAVEGLTTTFGDNDRLAALVTNLLRAPLLIILSDVKGLYDGPPDNPSSRLIRNVTEIDETITGYAQASVSNVSKGGMASKLEAARMCTIVGENVILAHGREPNIIERVARGEDVGTAFLAQGRPVSPWKRWIGFSAKAAGHLKLDQGACKAVAHEGRSLLAIGIKSVEGDFTKGDVVALIDGEGKELARGLTNYDSDSLKRIRGLRSDKIAIELGHCPYTEVIHRDNMTLTT